MADVLVTFGSGGHSSEMLMLIKNGNLDSKLGSKAIRKLVCLVSQDDELAGDKISQLFGVSDAQDDVRKHHHERLDIVPVKRARKVGQSYLTATVTTLLSLFNLLGLVYKCKPRICLTNGPAISVTLCLAVRLLRALRLIGPCQVIFVESFCRTRTLSMSAKVIYHLRLANKFLVQWPLLGDLYPRAQFRGLLV